ncbi:UDP-3-O-(3-hydroxymyristoyl)glucosamine N-acyltransferase [Leeia oryzae]|uniref:UDP-3-O-(3-hydroxymyristoyl)glucosamine N-acyltransferase n=1 Tax=Leeia oryzae TaxID=356662 RepID=UPI00035E2C8C|nr:UDP-3-O-(3-hydroxymyristoyl)glucosamine N-acyltransferase [Leeia oryzae]
MRLSELVEKLGGELRGPDLEISQVAPLDTAGQQHLSFLANRKYASQLKETKAGAVLLPLDLADAFSGSRILTANPYLYFARASQLINPLPKVMAGIHPSAYVSPSAVVDASAEIGPFVYVADFATIGPGVVLGSHVHVGERASVGADTRLMPHVTLSYGCSIGERGIVHAGVVIGADGFGIANDQGTWVKIPQIGRVVIGNDVEIGANTTIDRGAMADTVIEDGVKLDNQIQIAHNVIVGAHTAMAGCVGVAGSAKIGKHCTVGGGAIILGHLSIADHVNVSAGTLITKTIRQPGTYTGVFPFDEHDAWLKHAAQLKQFGRTAARLAALELQMNEQDKS